MVVVPDDRVVRCVHDGEDYHTGSQNAIQLENLEGLCKVCDQVCGVLNP
jgi:hypothetical protein